MIETALRGLFALGLVLGVPAVAASQGEGPARVARDRAIASWQALRTNFAIPGRPGAYYENVDRASQAFLWPHGQVMHAALDVATIARRERDFEDAVGALADYALVKDTKAYASDARPGPDAKRFWDDNGWVALVLLQASSRPGAPGRYVRLAAQLWPFFERGQAKPGGGQYWMEGDPKPNLGIPQIGSVDQAVLRLHLASGAAGRSSPYREFVELNERWADTHLRAPEGFYWNSWYVNEADNPTRSGSLCTWMFTYNQGLPIGVDLLRYRISGDRAFLDRAVATAGAALERFPLEKVWKQPAPFNAVFFRNLLVLDSYAPDPRYRELLSAYLEKAWTEARDPSSGLFRLGGVGLYDRNKPFGVINQAAFVQMYALLAWPAERMRELT